jgi:transposase InsO family protein
MTINMQDLEKLSVPEMEDFLKSNRKVRISKLAVEQAYPMMGRILIANRYDKTGKKDKGIIRRFLCKVTGRSRAQINRLIGRWKQERKLERKAAQRPAFSRVYTPADAVLLAEVDAAHEDLSGPAVRRLLKRAVEVQGDERYARLAKISVSHLYNLRRSASYRRQRVKVEHTKPAKIAIAERRKPDPRDQPGYLRVDTVHQGQHDGQPGVYHINAVDTVTQWEVVGCVETIAERHLIPVLEAILHQFPFQIKGFHCDNGSEFINRAVAGLLNKLLVEFTKSRAYRTTDNALVEGKNGAVVRKHLGHGPIPAEYAEQFQKFYTAHFNPYLNFHRPCGYATIVRGYRGKRKRVYDAEDYRTPYEKLTSLDDWTRFLKPGITAESLHNQATRRSDLDAAKQMQKAKYVLLAKARGLVKA